MHPTYHSSAPLQMGQLTTEKSSSLRLPNELVLDILLHVAGRHPTTLPKLYSVCRDWLRIIRTYEDLLWRHATVAAFPGSFFSHSLDEPWYDSSIVCKQQQDWKHTFSIHSGWLNKQAQALVIEPYRDTKTLTQNTDIPSSLSSEQNHVQETLHHESHNHQHQHHLHDHALQPPVLARDGSSVLILDSAMVTSAISNTSTDASSSLPFLIYPVAHHRLKSKLKDTMSCSLCTYAEICMIPQARVCVRTQRDRSRPLIQVLDWSMQESVDIDDSVNSHQDLVSGMAVNQQGTLLVTCSIDEAIRVWDVHQGWCCAVNGGQMEESFKDLVAKYGCPIQSRRALLGHIGWVNAVAIENTTVVSGGSDHTVRVWDAISGTLLRLIPNLFLSREIGLGVYAVAIHGSLIGSGSVIEGYQIHDFTTGKLLMDLDEPLPAKDHVQFESVLYQQYASRMAITDAVVVTNSKLEGMLCVWSRQTGRFLYRIRVCPRSRVPAVSTGSMDGVQLRDMVTHNASEPSGRAGMVVTGVGAGDDDRGENTVHTFKVNSSGSVLMCTLCDGRVSMFEFGMMQSQDHGCSWDVESSVQSVDSVDAEILDEEHQEHRCSALAWIWTRDTQGHNRLVSV